MEESYEVQDTAPEVYEEEEIPEPQPVLDTASVAKEKVTAKDPLHLIAYNGQTPGGGFGTSNTKHMFMVKASSPTSTLEVKVTDRFGNVYTESMARPKAFSLAAYK